MTETKLNSPIWSSTTKLVVALTLVTAVAALFVRFNNLIGPLLITFILSYLLHPLASRLHEKTKLSWRGSVNLIYLVFILVIAYLSTLSGVAAVDQFQSLIGVVQNFAANLPTLLQNLSTQVYNIGPFEFDFAQLESQLFDQLGLDFVALGEQVLNALQPLLGGAGSLLGTLASSALSTVGWGAFVLVISYFILADAGQFPDFFQNIELLGYDADIRRLGRELGRIWNAFMRGQLLLIGLIVLTSFMLMSILGVRNALGLAFLAGLAKLVPYVGPLVAGITTALVAFFQGGNYLGIEPAMVYATVVVVSAVVLDQIFDNLVTPRIYGQTLGVHPAAVLVAALIAASLLGVIGLLFAAPVLASLQLFVFYALRKMLDLDPWLFPEKSAADAVFPLPAPLAKLIDRVRAIRKRGDKNE